MKMSKFMTIDHCFYLTRNNPFWFCFPGSLFLDVVAGLPALILADVVYNGWTGVLVPLGKGIQNTFHVNLSNEFKEGAFKTLLFTVPLIGLAALGYSAYKVIQGGSSIAQDLSNLRSSITFSSPDILDKKVLKSALVGLLIGAAITGNQSR